MSKWFKHNQAACSHFCFSCCQIFRFLSIRQNLTKNTRSFAACFKGKTSKCSYILLVKIWLQSISGKVNHKVQRAWMIQSCSKSRNGPVWGHEMFLTLISSVIWTCTKECFLIPTSKELCTQSGVDELY